MAFLVAALLIPAGSYGATYGSADNITYSTASGDEVTFDEDDFNDACDDLTGEDLDYVRFTLPDSDYGILYYDYEDEDSTKVSASRSYYFDSSPYLSKVSFLPEDDFDGTVSVSYTGRDEDGNTFTGKVKITVSQDDSDDTAADILYTADGDEELEFDEDDFNDVCTDLNDEDLVYVKFSLPSSSAGTLYYNYKSEDDYGSKVASTTKYYYDETPYLSRVSFVPDEDYSGTVTVKYTGYDEDDNAYSGKVKIKVEDTASSEIAYTIDDDETADFDEDDFYEICDDLNDEVLDYVTFTLPEDSKGILYYNYDDGDYDSKVTASKKYYYDSSPYLSKVTFVPNSKFSGVCTVAFKGYDTDGASFSGAVEITVNGDMLSADPINYTAKTGSSVYFKEDDFNNVCKKLKGNSLNYVKFSLPSASSGKLYYGYTSASSYTSEVSASTKYYYGSTPFILNIAFVPASGASGTATVSYTGYDNSGYAFTGKVQIAINGTGSAVTVPTTGLKKSTYFKDVDEAYSWAVDYIDKLYLDGVVAGSTGTDGAKHFYPASKIKRGEFMLLLVKALNLQTNTSAGNFSDVVKGDYYYDAVATAKYLGIALGSENKFYPNSSITREDAMVLTMRAMSKSGSGLAAGDTGSLTVYSDNYLIDSYARDAVAALIKAGIITGSDDNKIHPMESISRVQAAAIIYRIKY